MTTKDKSQVNYVFRNRSLISDLKLVLMVENRVNCKNCIRFI